MPGLSGGSAPATEPLTAPLQFRPIAGRPRMSGERAGRYTRLVQIHPNAWLICNQIW